LAKLSWPSRSKRRIPTGLVSASREPAHQVELLAQLAARVEQLGLDARGRTEQHLEDRPVGRDHLARPAVAGEIDDRRRPQQQGERQLARQVSQEADAEDDAVRHAEAEERVEHQRVDDQAGADRDERREGGKPPQAAVGGEQRREAEHHGDDRAEDQHRVQRQDRLPGHDRHQGAAAEDAVAQLVEEAGEEDEQAQADDRRRRLRGGDRAVGRVEDQHREEHDADQQHGAVDHDRRPDHVGVVRDLRLDHQPGEVGEQRCEPEALADAVEAERRRHEHGQLEQRQPQVGHRV
jgi:hypothetical protein